MIQGQSPRAESQIQGQASENKLFLTNAYRNQCNSSFWCGFDRKDHFCHHLIIQIQLQCRLQRQFRGYKCMYYQPALYLIRTLTCA